MKIDGKTVMRFGVKPGPAIGKIIKHFEDQDVSEDDFSEWMDVNGEFFDPPDTTIPLRMDPGQYSLNLDAETSYEIENLSKVLETMGAVMRTPTVVRGAIMPDACPAGPVGTIPVGGVVTTDGTIHPGMHSADICCSVYMSEFMPIHSSGDNARVLLDSVQKNTHFGPGGRPDSRVKTPDHLIEEFANNPFLNDARTINAARTHMGTQGDGNHFAFVGFSRNSGNLCLITHHGSRGPGALLFKKGMRVAEKYRLKISPQTLKQNAWIPYDSEDGQNYWDALQLIRKWTKLNHQVIHSMSSYDSGMQIGGSMWNEHNFVFKEGDLFHHAKGATPMRGEFMPNYSGLSLIPMNMNQPVLVVMNNAENEYGFAPHGAGRNISRTQHKKDNAEITDQELFELETSGIDARFFSGKIDTSELPSAYKSADKVQAQMNKYDLATVVDRIDPYGCIMAGEQPRRW